MVQLRKHSTPTHELFISKKFHKDLTKIVDFLIFAYFKANILFHYSYLKLKKLKQELEEWKNITVKIAVIGQSGSGKSTFINKFRGLTPKDKFKTNSVGKKLYAPVGLKETTFDIVHYEFEENPLIQVNIFQKDHFHIEDTHFCKVNIHFFCHFADLFFKIFVQVNAFWT